MQQKGQGQADGVEPQKTLAVLVHGDGFAVVAGDRQQPIPQTLDLQVLSEDPIKFEILVKTMDAAMSSGFPNVSLLDAGASI